MCILRNVGCQVVAVFVAKIFCRSVGVKQGKNKAPVTLKSMSQAPVPSTLNTVLELDGRFVWEGKNDEVDNTAKTYYY